MSRVCAPGALIVAARATVSAGRRDSEWTVYGGGPGQERYSKLTQINPANVGRLGVAWTWDSGETGGLQTSPIIVGGVLYALTPTHRVVALDAATGSAQVEVRLWHRGPRPKPRRHVLEQRRRRRGADFCGSGHVSLCARRTHGSADRSIRNRRARRPARKTSVGDPSTQNVLLTSPGILYKDLLIIGGRVSEGLPGITRLRPRVRRANGNPSLEHFTRFLVRASTAMRPGLTKAWTYTGGANNWAGMAVDEVRGILYVPTGSASADFYGANRLGDNLFANALIALDARTGRRLWHFQSVHHDIWDRDFPSPPTLAYFVRARRLCRVDAVAQARKTRLRLRVRPGDGVAAVSDRRARLSGQLGCTANAPRSTQPVPIKACAVREDSGSPRTS